jgi:hypothetical protein
MAALDIRPHSPRISGWVVAGLMALGVSAFAAGMIHQIAPTGPLPFPPPQQVTQATPAAPAPVLQYASTERPAPRAALAVNEIPPNTSVSQSPAAIPDDDAQGPTAVDASAIAADPAPPRAEPPPQPPADSTPPT